MKLNDWPIWINNGYGKHWYECFLPVEPSVDGDDGPNCYDALGVEVETTLGELAGVIVEHAREQHGIEIEADGAWYRSFTPDGKLWAESRMPGDFTMVDTDGMEGEELEYWTERNRVAPTLRYERIKVYAFGVVEEWKPDEC